MATSKVPCDHGDHHPAAVLFDGEDLKLLRIIATSAPHVLELEVLSKPDTAELCRKALALVDGRDHLVLRRATLLHPFARMRVDIDRQSHHAYESIFIGADTPGARADLSGSFGHGRGSSIAGRSPGSRVLAARAPG